jgi:general secretion pathway protein M
MTLTQRLPVGRAGQALAVALTAIALLLVWEVVASPLIDWYATRADEVTRQRELAARMQLLVREMPVLQREAARSRAAGPPVSALLGGSSDAIAAASLQGRVQDMASGAGTALSSTEALPARQQGAYRRVALRVSFNADLPVLVHLLQTIEASAPRMLVDDIQLHTSPLIIAQGHQNSPPLDVSLTVVGFRAGHAADADTQATGQTAPGGDNQ